MTRRRFIKREDLAKAYQIRDIDLEEDQAQDPREDLAQLPGDLFTIIASIVKFIEGEMEGSHEDK